MADLPDTVPRSSVMFYSNVQNPNCVCSLTAHVLYKQKNVLLASLEVDEKFSAQMSLVDYNDILDLTPQMEKTRNTGGGNSFFLHCRY